MSDIDDRIPGIGDVFIRGGYWYMVIEIEAHGDTIWYDVMNEHGTKDSSVSINTWKNDGCWIHLSAEDDPRETQ